MKQNSQITEMVVEIVSAYVGHNQVPSTEVPQLIQSVHTALTGLSAPSTPKVVAQAPAVSVKKSVTPDYLICLEDGRRFKSLKRHLSTHYNLSPDEYRAKWNMPEDYPMVAPSYAAARSQLAKANGLGQSARNKPKARTRGASGKLRVKY